MEFLNYLDNGFAIAVCIYLLYKDAKFNKVLTEGILKLTTIIDERMPDHNQYQDVFKKQK